MPALQEITTKEANGFYKKEFTLQSRPIRIYVGDGREKIDVAGEYTTSAGSTDFDVVIEFDTLFTPMAGSVIPENQRWTEYQSGNTRILNNHPDQHMRNSSQASTQNITEIANAKMPDDPISIERYTASVSEITQDEKNILGDDFNRGTPIVALRAGYPMTKEMGYEESKMVLVDAKRLNGVADKSKLALGLRFVGTKEEILAKLHAADGKFVNADPALATGSTQLGILLWLLAESIPVSDFQAFSIASAQQGLALLDGAVNDLREQGQNFSFNVVTAGVHPELTAGEHPYYIKTSDGQYAVGDGGDWLDLTLPPQHRKRWVSEVTQDHITLLQQAYPEEDFTSVLSVGALVTLDLILSLQSRFNQIQSMVFGSIFKKENN